MNENENTITEQKPPDKNKIDEIIDSYDKMYKNFKQTQKYY